MTIHHGGRTAAISQQVGELPTNQATAVWRKAMAAYLADRTAGHPRDLLEYFIDAAGAGRTTAQPAAAMLADAAANGDTEVPGHAADLVTEFGAALLTSHGPKTMTVEHGCMIEAADLLEQVAGRIDTGEWSNCPCGTDHGQATLDAKVAPTMHNDAAFARAIADRSPNDPDAAGAR